MVIINKKARYKGTVRYRKVSDTHRFAPRYERVVNFFKKLEKIYITFENQLWVKNSLSIDLENCLILSDKTCTEGMKGSKKQL